MTLCYVFSAGLEKCESGWLAVKCMKDKMVSVERPGHSVYVFWLTNLLHVYFASLQPHHKGHKKDRKESDEDE